MEYRLTIEDGSCPVTVEKTQAAEFSAVIEGKNYRVKAARIDDHTLLLEVNGRQLPAVVVDAGGKKRVIIRGLQYEVWDEDHAEQAAGGRRTRKKKFTEVTPPTPAVVMRIPVKVGDAVTEGQAVAVVSAMKMETTLYAPFDGTVTGINVGEGDRVMPGDILVDIEKSGEAE